MNKLYPIDYITYYKKDGKLPNEVSKSIKETKNKGFNILKLTPDRYNVPNDVKAYHAGFKHMKEITIPKILKPLFHLLTILAFDVNTLDLIREEEAISFVIDTLCNMHRYPAIVMQSITVLETIGTASIEHARVVADEGGKTAIIGKIFMFWSLFIYILIFF